MKRVHAISLVLPALGTVLLAAAGCSVLNTSRNVFPFAFEGADGQAVALEDIDEIVNDPDLSDDEKRQALRDDLGIEDEDLIDALLTGF